MPAEVVSIVNEHTRDGLAASSSLRPRQPATGNRQKGASCRLTVAALRHQRRVKR
jgi:hypothetical protein